MVVTIIHSPPTASSDSQSYSLGVGPQYLLPPGSKNYLTSVLGVRTSLGPHSNYLYLRHPSTTLTGSSRRRLRRLSDGGLSLSHSHTLTLSLSHSLTLSYCHTLQGCLVLSGDPVPIEPCSTPPLGPCSGLTEDARNEPRVIRALFISHSAQRGHRIISEAAHVGTLCSVHTDGPPHARIYICTVPPPLSPYPRGEHPHRSESPFHPILSRLSPYSTALFQSETCRLVKATSGADMTPQIAVVRGLGEPSVSAWHIESGMHAQ